MELEKVTIKRHIPAGGDTIKALFNPSRYQISRSNQFVEVGIPGLKAPLLQFGRGNARTLSMQLFFDTYEQGTDVREHTGPVLALMDIDKDLHAPPVCQITWGSLSFIGVLEKAEQTFTLFYASGKPARATVDVTFKEFIEDSDIRQSANFAKRYVVQRGDTLSAIAARLYDDPTQWRPIAQENGIDNPLALAPGQVLVIPAIE